MTFIKKLVVSLIVLTLAFSLLEGLASADTATDESSFVSLINQERSAAGLAPLSIVGALTDNARNHSAQMAAAGTIFHNASLASEITTAWISLGENVGMGGSVDQIHQAFMASSGHRANILGDYNGVGVGVAYSGSLIYVTEVFQKVSASVPVVVSAGAPSASVSAGATVVKTVCRKVGKRKKCTRVRRRARRVRRRR